MHREGHIGIGLLLYSPVAYFLVANDLMTLFGYGLAGVAFWSFAPDIDMVLPIRHRGPTHTFLAAGVAGVLTTGFTLYIISTGGLPVDTLSNMVGSLAVVMVLGFAFGIATLGVVAHLLGDMITPMGIWPWWPVSSYKHSLGIVKAKNNEANKNLGKAGAIALTVAVVIATVW